MFRTAMIRALLVAGTGMLIPATTSPQAAVPKNRGGPSTAEQLEARAAAPKARTGDWLEAAKALERAASLRPSNDPRALNDLLAAATAYEIAGRLLPARRNAVEGARRATARGDVYTAANAYVAAARFSLELQDEKAAITYLAQANQLAASPALTAEQSRAIAAQVGRR